MIRGLLLILVCYWLGEAVSRLIDGLMPGSVIGLLGLFSGLKLKWVKPGHVSQTANVLAGHLALFLIPTSVGLMLYTQQLTEAIVVIGASILVSTTLTILVVALVQQGFERRAARKSTRQ